MALIASLVIGLLFPPFLVLKERNQRVLAGFLIAELVVLGMMFFVFWGPAVLAHMMLWAAGAWRRCRTARAVPVAGRLRT